MRTTIDVPDDLLRKAKAAGARRNMTFRALVLDALTRTLEEKPVHFRLRDASAGFHASSAKSRGPRVDAAAINAEIDHQRDSGGTV